VDELTWRVKVFAEGWSAAAWHVADEDSNVQLYQCPNGGTGIAVEQPV
jgi:hypothetical protein